ncbi:MAG TPA: DUF1326 domain-containing protein [Pyrinomonadaceae bacterium]|jgi:hypothetical protein
MRRLFWPGLVLAFLFSSLLAGSRAESNGLKGDYVEARTASVFAGACHYNGELTTAGREAVMAWSVAAGSWNGVDLAGVRVLAVVSADANLSDANAARRAELVVDQSATHAQAAAVVGALRSKYGAALGRIVSVRSAPVTFGHDGRGYSVASPGTASLVVEPMPNDLCCRMPHLVWYEPLAPLVGRKVGHTVKVLYGGGPLGDAWQRDGENSSFYGSFSF